MKMIDHDPRENSKGTPDALTVFSYFLAAAILIPIGWWLKANYAVTVGEWIRSFY